MESTLFTTLSPREEATLSGGNTTRPVVVPVRIGRIIFKPIQQSNGPVSSGGNSLIGGSNTGTNTGGSNNVGDTTITSTPS